MDVINNINNDRDLMEFAVPTIDAILTEEPQILREVVQNVVSSQGKDKFMQSLKSFMPHARLPFICYQFSMARLTTMTNGRAFCSTSFTSKSILTCNSGTTSDQKCRTSV
jgi:hypothetical protein